tara:strand:+ start:275 stop:781 length:507 start_codon:yes stop_codon:yes gene_type:complete
MEKQKKIVLDLLRNLKFPTTQRANVLRGNQKGYEGFVLGRVTSWAGKGDKGGYRKIQSAKTNEPKYKEIFKETRKLMKLKDPNFKYTSIQFNKNHRSAKHTDSKNMGVSYIIGLGDYTGGELVVYDEKGNNPVKIDIKNRFYKFNGSKFPHETANFKGERYSLVFYST